MKRENDAHFVLSRRNILNLLHMLDNRDKARPALMGGGFVIEAQEDDEHYGDRAAGPMSWEVEASKVIQMSSEPTILMVEENDE